MTQKATNLRSTLLRAAGMFVATIAASLCTHTMWGQTSATSHPRLSSQVVDPNIRLPLSGSTPLLSGQATDTGKLAGSEVLKDMKIVLRRSSKQQADLKAFLEDVQNPASPSYHQWLSPESVGERFGASDDDIAAVSLWLTGNGMTITSISKNRTVITFTGTESEFESAFQAEMHQYDLKGEARVASSSMPSVPAALAPALAGLATLRNANIHPLHTKPTLTTFRTGKGWSGNSMGPVDQAGSDAKPQFTGIISGNNYPLVGPADFGSIYGATALWNSGVKGTNQSIAIVAESNIALSDIDAFRKAFGLPAAKVNVTVLGPDPGLDASGSEGEALLDTEWAGAIAPDATINLLVAQDSTVQAGILIAAEYAVDYNISPILNLSWGACELGLGASGNQYLEDLWSQAAAQGISVIVSSGDAGSVACDQSQYYANYGQQVNGLASTEHATAIGGTDFYGNTEGVTKYWSVTNDPTTLLSVKSYITESAWNNSCANPLILLHAAGFGFPETTVGSLCDKELSVLTTGGGGGGISNCTDSDSSKQKSCTGGHPAPAWQQSLSGIGSAGKRHVPDVSLFAGSALWDSAYVYCEADQATGDMCDNKNGTMTALAAGGTSFGAPAFAGIVALINQQQGSRQGNVNKYLYALAAKQNANSILATNCQSGSGADLSSCIFHDIVLGTISEPCSAGTIVDPTTGALCVAIDPQKYLGVTPGYAATPGYDVATGLGSINVGLLASNWQSAVALDAASQTTHSIQGASSVPYGSTVTVAITVKAASGTVLPTGTAALLSTESNGSTLSLAGGVLANGTTQISFNSLLTGVHQIFATYGGDSTFGSSTSRPSSFTVVRAATTLALTASVTTVRAPNTSTLLVRVQTPSNALNPTGSIAFTNQTTGKNIATVALTALTDPSSGASWAQASLNVSASMLVGGNNVIVVSYAGDSNYQVASNQTVTIAFTPFYTITSSKPSLDITLGTSSQAVTTVTIASGIGGKVDPSVLLLVCQSINAKGVSCGFSTPVQNADGSVSSTLTLTVNSPQSAVIKAEMKRSIRFWEKGISMATLFGLVLLSGRRRRWSNRRPLMDITLCLLGWAMLSGCAGSSPAVSPAVTNQLTVSSNAIAYGTGLTLSSTLSPVANSASPGGTVVFYDGAIPIGSATVVGGRASLTNSTLSVGSHMLTSSYSGDAVFAPSTSSASAVSVSLSATVVIQATDASSNTVALSLPLTVH